MKHLPRGVVFDCDGTLADTESLADRAWRASLADRGYEPTDDDFRAVIGHPFPQNWEYFSERVDLGDHDRFRDGLRERFAALFDTDLELHGDAITTLRELADRGVPIGVASSSDHASVVRVLERAGVVDLVGAVVGLEDVAVHKPEPEPYLRAAEQLGVDPRQCSAVEDTPVGVRSARAAGMFTVAVVRSHGSAQGLTHAHRVVEEITLASLVRPR